LTGSPARHERSRVATARQNSQKCTTAHTNNG
jgi:hypothetical protein